MLFALIISRLRTRPGRTLLTTLGIGVAIATIVVLSALTQGLVASLQQTLQTGGADLTLLQADSVSPILSKIPERLATEITDRKDVVQAIPILFSAAQSPELSFFVVQGIRRTDLAAAGVRILDGRVFRAGSKTELLLGRVSATNLKLHPGDKVTVLKQRFTVVGIYETGVSFQDSGVYLDLKTAQDILNRTNEVSFLAVDIAPGADLDTVSSALEKQYPTLAAIRNASDFNKIGQGLDVIQGFRLVLAVLATVIGGIGIANTMLTSVLERTREIGVLRAVGWSGRRVLFLVLGEAFLLGALGYLVGVGLGVGAAIALTHAGGGGALVTPVYSVETFSLAFGVALAVSLLGGLYPALRAIRLLPKEALRYE